MDITLMYELGGLVIAFVGATAVSHRQLKKDTRELVDLKLAPISVKIDALADRFKAVEKKLDRLIQR